MVKNLLLGTFASTALVFSSSIMAVKPSQAAQVIWDLEFLNDSGEQIGTGSFSYNNSTPFSGTFENIYGLSGDKITVKPEDKWYRLESFTATIEVDYYGEMFASSFSPDLSSYGLDKFFWREYENFGSPVQVSYDYYFTGDPDMFYSWVFDRSNRYELDFPNMFFSAHNGTLTGYFLYAADYGVETYGTWQAHRKKVTEQVPEGSTILGSITGILGLGLFKWKYSKKLNLNFSSTHKN